MRSTPALRTVVLAVLAGLTAFQLIGLTTALVSASRERVTDFGIGGPGLGGYANLARIRRTGGLPVDSVSGPGLAAGLERGDVITHVDGVAMTERPGVWYRGRFTTPPGTALRLTVRREARTFDTVLHTTRLAEPLRVQLGSGGPDLPHMDYRAYHWWTWGPNLLMSLLLFIVGLAIGILRRDEPVAWTFALVFLGVSLATSISSGTPLLHVWPPGLVMFWSVCVIGAIGYSVPLAIHGMVRFPGTTRLSRRLWRWRWVPWVVIGSAAAAEIVVALARFSFASLAPFAGLARAADAALNFGLAFGFICMGVLLAGHMFERPGPGGDRLRVLWYGGIASVIGGLWSVLIPPWFWFRLVRPLGSNGAWVAQALANLVPPLLVSLLPLSFAYTILARRLFGIRFVIRRGLQHLLLSRGVLVIEGVLLFLGLETMIRHTALVGSAQGPALAGVLALLAVAGIAAVNRPLMQSLDRRFFRDRYDARRVMMGLGRDLGLLRERDEILRRTGEAIVSAIHPVRVAIFLRSRNGDGLRCEWMSDRPAAEYAETDEAAELSSRLSRPDGDVWMMLDRPAAAEEPSSAGADNTFGMTAPAAAVAPRFELCIPLRQAGRVSGCIALAAKLSDEPYTSEDRELLVTVANQAALALENADLLGAAKREAQLARDVEIARQVQANLFPRHLPVIPGWEVAAVCRPARTVAGDYYDVVRCANGDLGVALGDVSGKGVGASLLSAGVHAMVRSRLPARECDLGALMQDLNTHLLESSADEMFATVVLARITPADGRVTYVNAGHPPPLLVGAGGEQWLDESGPLAGVIPQARYVLGEVRLEPGDLLMIYSDGVTEAERAGGEFFGLDRLVSSVSAHAPGNAEAAVQAVLCALETYAGTREPLDDISIVAVMRKK
jgi:sigma-B regulation protein RsbU (phosphoserine phosphatase)